MPLPDPKELKKFVDRRDDLRGRIKHCKSAQTISFVTAIVGAGAVAFFGQGALAEGVIIACLVVVFLLGAIVREVLGVQIEMLELEMNHTVDEIDRFSAHRHSDTRRT